MKIRYFSYVNWEIATGCSPFLNDEDRSELKKYDGKMARHIGKMGVFEEDAYMVSTPWGPRTLPALMFRGRREPDLSEEEIQNNPYLQEQLTMRYKMDILMEPYSFITPAYIETDHNIGFAMVSVSEGHLDGGTGQFALQSDFYVIPAELKDKIDNELKPMFWTFWPSGTLDDHSKVYRMHIERIEHYIDYLFPDNTARPYVDIDHFMPYLDKVTENSFRTEKEYELFEKEGIEYQKACLMLLDSLHLSKIPVPHTQRKPKHHAITLSAVKNFKRIESARVHGTQAQKIMKLKGQGYTIGQVAKKLGLNYKIVSQYWNDAT